MYDPNYQQSGAYYGGGSGYDNPYGGPGDMSTGVNDNSNYYVSGGGTDYSQAVASQNFINDPMATMAMAYGQSLVGQGKQIVDQKFEKYVPVSKLKYYFAVDTSYVRRKLSLVLFPYANSDWSMKYQQDEPVAPRYEVNAPDLYIPTMAFVTFILVAGISLGTQNKFSPEQLGIQASSALGWLVVEIVVLLVALYVANIHTDLSYLEFISFCSYKYIGMICSVCIGMLFFKMGYYVTLAYTSASLCFFLVKTLRVQILPKAAPSHQPSSHGNKRRMYLLLCIAVAQPVLMFVMTHHLIPVSYVPTADAVTSTSQPS